MPTDAEIELIQKKQEQEIILRGSALTVASAIEVVIMDIVYFSHSGQYNSPYESKSLEIKKVTFGGKIEKLKTVIKKHHPDLFKSYKSMFDDLGEFLEIRNKLAHNAVYFVDDGV